MHREFFINGNVFRAKKVYELDDIKAILSGTSHSVTGAILLDSNPVKFAELQDFRL